MKKSKLLIAVAASALFISSFAYAGGKSYSSHGGNHGIKLERMVHKLSHKLDLSDTQEQEIEQIIESNRETMKSQRSERRALRTAMMKLDPTSENYDSDIITLADQVAQMAKQRTLHRADLLKQIAQVLTTEQQEKARQIIEKRLSKMEHRRDSHTKESRDN